MTKKPKYLVTAALPYANGPLHIGHVAGAYLPADIFVRYNKMKGNDVIFISGTDEHGVPITITADNEKKSPLQVVEHYHKLIAKSFEKLDIVFDNFSGTARSVHHDMSKQFFLTLNKNGYIKKKESEQYYCSVDKMFLPDRFLLGVCPQCGFDKARGDECPSCGKWLEAEKLMEPRCKICSNTPSLKKTEHWYLCLDKFSDKLKDFISTREDLKPSVKKFALSWIKEGLRERAITRDLDWGVPVPLDEAGSKVLYVWFDAPIGYISSTIEWSEKIGDKDRWKDYWFDPDCKLVHFIGKDNIPFHIVVWPSLLMGQDLSYIMPYDIPANEHLTIEGSKLSTSEGNVVWVDDVLERFSCDSLRYYLASMAPEKKDADFSWLSFQNKNNKELNNVLGNFVNRTLVFIKNNFDGIIPSRHTKDINSINSVYLGVLEKAVVSMPNMLERFAVRDAISLIMDIVRIGNVYFDGLKPWELIKSNIKSDKEHCGTVLYTCALAIKTIAALLYPFMPKTASEMWTLIGEDSDIKNVAWDDISSFKIKERQAIGDVKLLFRKIEDKEIQDIIADYKKRTGFTKTKEKVKEKAEQRKSDKDRDTSKAEVSIKDFDKLDILVGTVLSAAQIEKSKKLLKLSVSFGDFTRDIVSGIALDYKVEDIVGKQVLAVVNLKEIKLMGQSSRGMVLLSSDNGELVLLSPIKRVSDGSRVS